MTAKRDRWRSSREEKDRTESKEVPDMDLPIVFSLWYHGQCYVPCIDVEQLRTAYCQPGKLTRALSPESLSGLCHMKSGDPGDWSQLPVSQEVKLIPGDPKPLP